jgi:hypothetical protein
MYIHTYHSRFVPEGVAEISKIHRDNHVLPKLFSYEEYSRRDSKTGKLIILLLIYN